MFLLESSVSRLSSALSWFVVVEHVGFWVLESFLWTSELGLSTFGMTAEQAAATSTLAFNQGFYNLILALGWALAGIADPDHASATRRFFLSAVVLAGVVGGLSANPAILVVQGLPAVLALATSARGSTSPA